MYSELDRTWIRHYVGFGAIYHQSEPRLESSISATQASADPGGTRPDSSTENYVKGLLYGAAAVSGLSGVAPGPVSTTTTVFATPFTRGLLQIEAQIASMDELLGVLEAVGDAKLDTVRETKRLRSEGRRLCHALARMLGMRGVRADMFSTAPIVTDDDPFSYSDVEHWRGWPRFSWP